MGTIWNMKYTSENCVYIYILKDMQNAYTALGLLPLAKVMGERDTGTIWNRKHTSVNSVYLVFSKDIKNVYTSQRV